MRKLKQEFVFALGIFIYFLFQVNQIIAQESVFQAASLQKISLAATKKPVVRKLEMKKWFTSKTESVENFRQFQEHIKALNVYITPPLLKWIESKYFPKTTNPLDETWILLDGNSLIIRHYSPDKAKDLEAEIYSFQKCTLQCKDLGFKKQLQYLRNVKLIKYNPKDNNSFSKFKKELEKNNVVLRNYQIKELKEKFFNAKKFIKEFPKDDLVSWAIFSGDKLIVRFARQKNDIDFSAISIPYNPTVSKGWQLKTNVDASGFSTTAEDIESYLNLGGGFELKRIFYNSWGSIKLSNSAGVQARLIEEANDQNPNTYKYGDSTLLQQEFLQQFQLFSTLDFYHDSASGIILGARILPGIGWNILGYGNRFRFDPVLSTAAGYRYEKDEIGDGQEEVIFKDIILSHSFSLGNKEYGGALFYWQLKVGFQHSLLSSNSNDEEAVLYSPKEKYRVNYLVQIGVPILNGNFKLFLTYLQEDISDQLDITNKSGMLSFEAKIF